MRTGEGGAGLNVVTGAFSYSGQYIARRLLGTGESVRTLTGRPGRPDPFGGGVEAMPLAFDHPAELIGALRGASTLYDTYWVRFEYSTVTFESATRSTLTLFQAARDAGVGRIIHVSITGASIHSALPYFRGKGRLEGAPPGWPSGGGVDRELCDVAGVVGRCAAHRAFSTGALAAGLEATSVVSSGMSCSRETRLRWYRSAARPRRAGRP